MPFRTNRMLRVDIDAVGHAVRLRCTGRIVLGLEAETLRCMAESRTEPCLILDLSEIHAMDATGLGLLVELHCRRQRRNQVLRIAKASRCVHKLIALVNLHSVLDVAESGLDDDQTRLPFVRRSLTA
jgi:anti-anti-sigma factor